MERPHELMRSLGRHVVVAGAALVPLLVLVVFFAVPVGAMLQRGFFPAGHLDLGGVADALWRPRVGRVVWFTLWSSTVATVATVVLGVPTAYVLHRLAIPGRRVLRTLVAVPFVLPTVVVGVAFRTLLVPGGLLGGWHLDGSPAAIVAALVFFNVSVVVRIVGPWWESLDQRPAEAAAALGASPQQVLRTVTWPMLLPAVLSAARVVFLFCATAFGVVLTLGGVRYSTVETEIYLLTTQFLDLQGAAALSVLQAVVVVGLLVASRRRASLVRRGTGPVVRPRPRHVPALAVAAATGCLLAVPLLSLAVRSLRRDGHWSLLSYRTLGSEVPGAGGTVVGALESSVRIAAAAAGLGVAIGLLVAVLVTRRPRARWRRRALAAYDGVFMLPLGVSAVTVGFGFLIGLDRPPLDFRGSPALIVVAQALVALPLVVRTVVPALRGVDPRTREAAASLGATPVQVWRTVELPVLRRPALVAAGFAVAVSLGEFGATSFLARPDAPTLPVLIARLASRPGADSFGEALAASVVLGGLAAFTLLAVEAVEAAAVVRRPVGGPR